MKANSSSGPMTTDYAWRGGLGLLGYAMSQPPTPSTIGTALIADLSSEWRGIVNAFRTPMTEPSIARRFTLEPLAP
jgi:hypothetical protein